MFEKKLSDNSSTDFDTVIGPSIAIEGSFSGKGNILVAGKINGSIDTAHKISIEEGAVINAEIQAESAVIAGEVNGNISVQGSLELLSTSKIKGDITAENITIEKGAMFNGSSSMQTKNPSNGNKENKNK